MAALCGGTTSAWAQEAQGASAAAPGWPIWLLFGLACTAAGYAWAQARNRQALREARDAAQRWQQLPWDLRWQSDAQHRLTRWLPPADSPADSPPDGVEAPWAPALGRPLVELFRLSPAPAGHIARMPSPATETRGGAPEVAPEGAPSDAPGDAAADPGWQQRLDSHGPWQRLAVWSLVDQGAWQLSAQPCFDAHGRFIGYEGLARRVAPAPATPDGRVAPAASPEPSHPAAVPTEPTPGPTVLEQEQESFVYSISHDLRAPIRVVEGFTRILKEDYGRFLDRIGNDHLDRVLAASARMQSMIDALLALSRLQSQPVVRKPVDLSQLATYVLEDLRREQPERAAEVEIEPGIVVQGDPTLLRVVLENLLGNAWKYSGKCALTRIAFRRERQGKQPVLVVADHGAGFDMRFADRLFGVFQRLHSAKDFQGTGVGLASVRRIIRRHGGEIWAESEVGQGARFYFTLAD